MVSQPPGQLVYDLLEDHRVHVLPEHVEEEPVAHLGLLDDDVDALLLYEPESDVEQIGPHPGRDYDDDAVKDDHGCEAAQDQEPEPEEDVDLLIDDIDGQDAEGIVALNVSRRAKLVEGAFGHAREYVDDRVHPVFFVAEGEGDDLDAKCEEGPVEETVHEEQLAWNKQTGGHAAEGDVWNERDSDGGQLFIHGWKKGVASMT